MLKSILCVEQTCSNLWLSLVSGLRLAWKGNDKTEYKWVRTEEIFYWGFWDLLFIEPTKRPAPHDLGWVDSSWFWSCGGAAPGGHHWKYPKSSAFLLCKGKISSFDLHRRSSPQIFIHNQGDHFYCGRGGWEQPFVFINPVGPEAKWHNFYSKGQMAFKYKDMIWWYDIYSITLLII